MDKGIRPLSFRSLDIYHRYLNDEWKVYFLCRRSLKNEKSNEVLQEIQSKLGGYLL